MQKMQKIWNKSSSTKGVSMSFRTNIIRSFRLVKQDIDSLKDYVYEWFNTIISNQRKLLNKINELEQRVEELEK